MDAKNSHNMPSARWRTRKVTNTTQPKSEGLRTRGAVVQGQGRWMFQLKKRESLFFLPFSLMDWLMATHADEGVSSLFCLLTQLLISSRNTFTDIPRNNVLPADWASLSLVKLTQKISHHSLYTRYLWVHYTIKIDNMFVCLVVTLKLYHRYNIACLCRRLSQAHINTSSP
jgi:hypothetical protein